MNRALLFLTVFSVGYVFNDIVTEFNFDIINEAQADVAGMSHSDLRRDRDFKKAVKSVVSGNCFVDGESIYCY